ncbi:hypothetical protein HQ403_02210 [Candidatus Kaiserbacteria bacterium]|nr:hypothetical protein [Candidatus Kaiserbacteria bacterium]
MSEFSGYELPPHRKKVWVEPFLWNPFLVRCEKGFVKKGDKKIDAHFRLTGLFFWRQWKLVKVDE